MTRYDTNLASEFYILSCLHRLGMNATLTLGNKKSVDIVVVRENEDAVTIDVKAVASKYDWPADNIRHSKNLRHFIVLVCYEGKFEDTGFSPNVWIIPAKRIADFKKKYNTRSNVSRSLILKKGQDFLFKWDALKKD